VTESIPQRADERSLSLRISGDLAARIRRGDWRPGFRIPFEHELTAQYGCARATANKAVLSLVAAGLVERRRRAGSFVARPHLQSAVLQIPDIEAEISGRGQAYGYDLLLRRERQGSSSPDESALGAKGRVLQIHCRHLANGRPLAVEERIVNLEVVPEAGGQDFTTQAPGPWLLAHVAWSEARHQIEAINPPKALAARLGVAPADACLSVKRWTWREGEGVTFVRQIFPGASYDLVARFTPGSH
jgi:GntR family transcriptional regulator, histidine utilization repressor